MTDSADEYLIERAVAGMSGDDFKAFATNQIHAAYAGRAQQISWWVGFAWGVWLTVLVVPIVLSLSGAIEHVTGTWLVIGLGAWLIGGPVLIDDVKSRFEFRAMHQRDDRLADLRSTDDAS